MYNYIQRNLHDKQPYSLAPCVCMVIVTSELHVYYDYLSFYCNPPRTMAPNMKQQQ